MIVHTLLTLATLVPAGTELAPSRHVLATPVQDEEPQADPRAEFERMRKEAEGDTTKLWAVHAFCLENEFSYEARRVLNAIIEVDADDLKARELLGHVNYEDKWFVSQRAVEDYKKEQVAKEMRAKGLVEANGQWVTPEDAPYVRRGMVKMDDGRWVTPEEKKYIEEGWKQQDLVWVHPDEWDLATDQGLWKCGEDWFTLEEADKYHETIPNRWTIPYPNWVVHTTTARSVADASTQWADWVYGHLTRAFGAKPKEPAAMLILNNLGQYNGLANGAPFTTEVSAYSSVHASYIGEAWFDNQTASFPRAAITYWDVSENNSNFWGPMRVRGAAALAYIEGVDPSPNAENTFVRNPSQFPGPAFWSEKQVPLWMRYGVARYVEVFIAPPSGDNPEEWRAWAIDMIKNSGGLAPLDTVFRFALDPNNKDGSTRLVDQAGLLINFVLDAEVPTVVEKHRAFKAALRDGGDVRAAVRELQEEIKAHEAELREFGGIPAPAPEPAAKEAASGDGAAADTTGSGTGN